MKNPSTSNKDRLSNMLSICYELEGLITLALNREDTTPAQVYDMINGKVRALGASVVAETPSLPFEDLDAGMPATAEPAGLETDDSAEAAVEEEVSEAEAEEVAAEEEIAEPVEMAEAVEFEQKEDADVDDTPTAASEDKRRSQKIALTIGDKFRFTRELFDGSEADLKEAVSAVSSMTSKDEIDDYLYNDLCFDEMNPTVKEFEELLTRNL